MPYITRQPTLDIYHVGVTSMRPINYNLGTPQGYYGYYAFDPSKSLINKAIENSWASNYRELHNQRIWANLNTSYIITRLYYENYHDTPPPDTFNPALIAGDQHDGAYEGSIWGSNIQPEAYGSYGELTKLWEGQFEIHSINNTSDPHYITFINNTPFQYYTIDVNNNYDGNCGIGFRRLEWQELL